MSGAFASKKNAISECGVCGFQYKLTTLKPLTIKGRPTEILACKVCWVKENPQIFTGTFPVYDPQAIEDPRPDTTYWQSGWTGLQVDTINPTNPSALLSFGYPGEGSRVIQWGWNPVGLNNPLDLSGLEDYLEATASVGSVTVTV
jgi:hypothetical protein